MGYGSADRARSYRLLSRVGKQVEIDHIGSVTYRLQLDSPVWIVPPGRPRMGDVVVVRVAEVNPDYPEFELTNGEMVRLAAGDLVVGVLGARMGLRGFFGRIPGRLTSGQRLHLLNRGGVVGVCGYPSPELGWPSQAELLGMAHREGRVLNISQKALQAVQRLESSAPLILVSGSCMRSGKTVVAYELIAHFSNEGYRVSAGKVSGVACLRDLVKMRQSGAAEALSFLDCGYPSTVHLQDLRPLARTILHHLNVRKPDLIVLELGDGLLGGYHVDSIFGEPVICSSCVALIFCANDFVGAWGGVQLLREYGMEVDLISGPATDSVASTKLLQDRLHLPAANALRYPSRVYGLISRRIRQRSPAFFERPPSKLGCVRAV